jgi:hypothetical protein
MKYARFPFIVKLFFFLMILTGAFPGCKKKTREYTGSIVVGDYSVVMLQKIGYTIQPGYPGENRYEMDANKDGIQDLGISCYNGGSPGGGSLPGCRIATLNSDIQLFVVDRPDSSFFFVSHDTTRSGDSVWYFTRTYSGCKRKSVKDSLVFVGTVSIPEIVFSGTTLNKDFKWMPVDYTMASTPYAQTTVNFGGPNEFYVTVPEVENNCNRPQIGQDMYYGIRMKEGDSFRLGWIRLKLEGKGTVYVEEVALESNL